MREIQLSETTRRFPRVLGDLNGDDDDMVALRVKWMLTEVYAVVRADVLCAFAQLGMSRASISPL